MKLWKVSVALLLAAALLALGGCKRSGVEDVGQVLENWRYEGTPNPPASAKPEEITQTENGDFSEALGFRLSGLPAADDLTLTASWAIDWFGQVEYDADLGGEKPWKLVVRVAPAASRQLGGTYNESHTASDETVTLDGLEVRVRTAEEGCALYTWERDGYQFSLHSNKLQGEIPDDMLAVFVESLAVEAAGGASGASGSGSA